MKTLLILLAVVGAALAAPSGHTPPASLAECVAREKAGPSEDMKAKFEGFKTCAKACFDASGYKPTAANTATMSCFKAAKADARTLFQSSTVQEAKSAFLDCAGKTCSAAPLPKSVETDHTSHHSSASGPHTYDATNPRDKHMCAMGLLMQAAKAAGASRPDFTDAQKTALHSCMDKCHPDHPDHADHTSQSSGHEGGKGHHGGFGGGRKHRSCLKHFCTKANFDTCKSNFASAKSAFESHQQTGFATTCGCLAKIGGNVDCSGPSDATCNAVFAKMHEMFQKKHSSTG